MSLIGLWTRRCRGEVLSILAAMAAVEAALFAWALHRTERLANLEQTLLDSHIDLAAIAAFTALTAILTFSGKDRGAKSSYTLHRLAMTGRQAFLCRAAHNTMCFFILWGAQLALVLCLCFAWRWLLPGVWERQTLLLAFYRVPFLHGLLPLGDWYVYPRNILWCMAFGFMTAREKEPAYRWVPFAVATGIYFPRKMGADIGWAVFIIGVSVFAIVASVWTNDKNGGVPEKEASGDGAEA